MIKELELTATEASAVIALYMALEWALAGMMVYSGVAFFIGISLLFLYHVLEFKEIEQGEEEIEDLTDRIIERAEVFRDDR